MIVTTFADDQGRVYLGSIDRNVDRWIDLKAKPEYERFELNLIAHVEIATVMIIIKHIYTSGANVQSFPEKFFLYGCGWQQKLVMVYIFWLVFHLSSIQRQHNGWKISLIEV